jgi:Phosphoglucomutase
VLNLDAIKKAGLHVAADPLGGASVHYWQLIAQAVRARPHGVNPLVDPRWAFMTLDWDEKIRMDPSSPP